MGEDHPMVWWHQVGEGRVLYSALGHTTATYDEPEFKIFIRNSILWLVGGSYTRFKGSEDGL